MGRIACFAELAARREKKRLCEIKNFKKFFFPPRRQATLSWLGGFAFMRNPHKGHQEPGIRAGACASKHGGCLVFAPLGVHGMVFDVLIILLR